MVHMPPSVKQLLRLRNPDSLPSLPLAKLHGILHRTLLDAKVKKAETGWLVLAVRNSTLPTSTVTVTIFDSDLHSLDCQSPIFCGLSVPLRDQPGSE